MSVNFYISPYNRLIPETLNYQNKNINELKINFEDYRNAILTHWPLTKVEMPPKSDGLPALCHWILPSQLEGFSGLRVALLLNLQVVVFGTGPKKVFLEFILWHRNFVPANYPLFLFNSSSTDSLKLKNDVKEQDIIDFTGIID